MGNRSRYRPPRRRRPATFRRPGVGAYTALVLAAVLALLLVATLGATAITTTTGGH